VGEEVLELGEFDGGGLFDEDVGAGGEGVFGEAVVGGGRGGDVHNVRAGLG